MYTKAMSFYKIYYYQVKAKYYINCITLILVNQFLEWFHMSCIWDIPYLLLVNHSFPCAVLHREIERNKMS